MTGEITVTFSDVGTRGEVRLDELARVPGLHDLAVSAHAALWELYWQASTLALRINAAAVDIADAEREPELSATEPQRLVSDSPAAVDLSTPEPVAGPRQTSHEPPSETTRTPARSSGADELTCVTCGRSYQTRQGLASHARTAHAAPAPCPLCGKMCGSPYAVKMHIARGHPDYALSPAPVDQQAERAPEREPVEIDDERLAVEVNAEVAAAPPAGVALCGCGHSSRLHEDREGACGACDCTLLDLA